MTAREPQAPASANMIIGSEIAMKKRLLAWLLSLAMLLTVGAVAAAETNPNAGLGYYPGTSEKGWISVECSTMSKMNPFLQTYSTEFSINRHSGIAWSSSARKTTPSSNCGRELGTSEDGMNWTFHIRQGHEVGQFQGRGYRRRDRQRLRVRVASAA